MADIIVERDVSVAMRDGVELATDVYRPANEEPAPTLVHRIPYDKSFAWYVGTLVFNPLVAVERGYAVVVQDTRGRFASAGEWIPFEDEADDGYDTVEWAAAQPWSDGHVGVYGSSYMGVTTWQTAVADPPHLEAVVAYLTGGNYHDGWVYTGGAFELGFNLHWALGLSWDGLAKTDLPDTERSEVRAALEAAYVDTAGAASHRPLRSLSGLSSLAPYWETWLDHPAYDEYWADVDVTAKADRISAPVLHVTGWYDNFLRGHLDVYDAIEAARTDDGGVPAHRMLLGPWDHGAYLSSTPNQVGDWRFGPELAGGASFMSERTFSWFDHWLKDEPLDAGAKSGVAYFDLGQATWEETPTWPPTDECSRFYLDSAGSANTRFGDGTLTTESPPQSPPDGYVYNPADPVPTVGGRTLMPEALEGGVKDQSSVEERPDVLVYTGPRLTESLSIAGPVSVRLHAETSAPDTDFTAKLVDVAPDGYCAIIADGILRLSYRDGMDDLTPADPGTVYGLDVDLWAVAHTFDVGHRVRLEISSSNFPRFDAHPNVAGPLADVTDEEVQRATQRVHHDADRPSHLSLPVVE